MTILLPTAFLSFIATTLSSVDLQTVADTIDKVAHQKYASVSGLVWHTDLASAQEAARTEGKPILHLRMLGSLEEDLSCANSRLFRSTLYANKRVSAFLRDHFILVWTSERPVPQITIDFGDGRKIETTGTGNSAHYVMDADGHVLDVLPGLYAAPAFLRELEGSLALAKKIAGASDADRQRALVAHHEHEIAESTRQLSLLDNVRIPGTYGSMVEMGQRMTITKAAIEVRPLRSLGAVLSEQAYSPTAVDLWERAGRALYEKDGPHVLDEASRGLVVRLHAHSESEKLVVAKLERHILADTALNQLVLRTQISRELVRRLRADEPANFATLNTWVYANVFHTPASDPWLGLLPRDTFTGLPGDGAVMP